MKQRIITGIIGLLLFFGLLFLFDTYFFNALAALVAVMTAFEVLHAYKMEKHPLVMVASCAFAGIVPMFVDRSNTLGGTVLVIAFAALLCGYALARHEHITVEMVGLVFFLTVFFTFAIMPFLYMRNQFGVTIGLYYTLFVFACSWGSDTGAYFAGRFFGKHKLSPKLSPNKTIEGVVGGVLSCFVFVGIMTAVFVIYSNSVGEVFKINYLLLAVIATVASLVGVAGDLFASMIKRQCGVKDFGHIMPGHGGMLDRLDSTYFIAPFFFVIVQFVVIASIG